MWFVWTPNSWGGHGQGKISEEALVVHFENGAEAAIPQQRLLKPT